MEDINEERTTLALEVKNTILFALYQLIYNNQYYFAIWTGESWLLVKASATIVHRGDPELLPILTQEELSLLGPRYFRGGQDYAEDDIWS